MPKLLLVERMYTLYHVFLAPIFTTVTCPYKKGKNSTPLTLH